MSLLSAAAACVVAEGGLRLAGFSFPVLYTRDETTGARHRPGAEGWNTEEGRAYYRINSSGFRDRDHAIAKPPYGFRIAVLGDSFTEALQVAPESTFPSVLERELDACPGRGSRRLEVLNFGVNAYGTAQELLVLRRDVWRFQPDLVVLAFFTGNDIRNNSIALETDRLRPFFVREASGALRADMSFRENPEFRASTIRNVWERLNDHSRVIQLARWARLRVRASRLAKAAETRRQGDRAVYSPPTGDWTAAWDVTEELLRDMSREVQQHGARFLLVALSNPEQVHPDPRVTEQFARALGVKDLTYPDTRLRAFAEREGLDALFLAPLMHEAAQRTGVYFHGFPNTARGAGHWNEDGHAFAGRAIAAHLCAQWEQ